MEKEAKAKVVLKRKPAVDSDVPLSSVADPHSFHADPDLDQTSGTMD